MVTVCCPEENWLPTRCPPLSKKIGNPLKKALKKIGKPKKGLKKDREP